MVNYVYGVCKFQQVHVRGLVCTTLIFVCPNMDFLENNKIPRSHNIEKREEGGRVTMNRLTFGLFRLPNGRPLFFDAVFIKHLDFTKKKHIKVGLNASSMYRVQNNAPRLSPGQCMGTTTLRNRTFLFYKSKVANPFFSLVKEFFPYFIKRAGRTPRAEWDAFFVFEEVDSIPYFAGFATCRNDVNKRKAVIDQFLILPPFQGMGVGSWLLRSMYRAITNDDEYAGIHTIDAVPTTAFNGMRRRVEYNMYREYVENVPQGGREDFYADPRNVTWPSGPNNFQGFAAIASEALKIRTVRLAQCFNTYRYALIEEKVGSAELRKILHGLYEMYWHFQMKFKTKHLSRLGKREWGVHMRRLQHQQNMRTLDHETQVTLEKKSRPFRVISRRRQEKAKVLLRHVVPEIVDVVEEMKRMGREIDRLVDFLPYYPEGEKLTKEQWEEYWKKRKKKWKTLDMRLGECVAAFDKICREYAADLEKRPVVPLIQNSKYKILGKRKRKREEVDKKTRKKRKQK